MHQSALFFTLATVALGASASVTADVNLLNPGTLAAHTLNINVHANDDANVKSESSIVRHPITVELGKILTANANVATQEKNLVDAHVTKRLDLNIGANTQAGSKLINVNLSHRPDVNTELLKDDKPVDVTTPNLASVNMNTAHTQDNKLVNLDVNRHLDVKADVATKGEKLVDAHVAKRLDLHIGADTQGHKLINVDLNPRAIVDAEVVNQEKKLVDAHVAKRLDLHIGANTQGHKLINVDLNPRAIVDAEVVNQEKKLVDAHVAKRLDLHIGANTQGHKLINVDLNPRAIVDAEVVNQEKKLVDAHVAKRLDLHIGANTQGHKLINVDLNPRAIVDAEVVNQDKKIVDAHVVKRLDLHIGANTQEGHKLINVNLGQRSVDATILPTSTDAATPQVANVNLARGRMPTAIEVNRRHLNVNVNAQTASTAQGSSNPVDINVDTNIVKRLDLNINDLLAKEHKLITVDLGNKKRDFHMSSGYVLDTAKVDANSDALQASQKRDLNVNVKADTQRLAARRSDDNDDDWEDEDDESEDRVLNEQESTTTKETNKEADKKNTASSATDDKKKNSEDTKSTSGQKKNSASRSASFTGLSIVGLLVGSAFMWA
ncbi:hypothetical protein EC991_007392 [Linnemannia zychae]|nr:hypothetical protein EC991_007392 [Linnemannia zychae]